MTSPLNRAFPSLTNEPSEHLHLSNVINDLFMVFP